MDGVATIRKLLTENAALLAVVPESRIKAGIFRQGTTLPAISLMSVSSVDRNIMAPGAMRMVIDRIQVTVLAQTYPSLKSVMRLVKKAAADQMPEVDGITDVVVHTDGQGADFVDDDTTLYLGTQDFKVSYNQAT